MRRRSVGRTLGTVIDAPPRVLVAVKHPAMCRLILQLLERDRGRWLPTLVCGDPGDAARALRPDLVIVDGGDPSTLFARLGDFRPDRVVVIGPEPDDAYETAARRLGAGGWLARDQVADHLTDEMAFALRSGPQRSSVVAPDAGRGGQPDTVAP